MATSTFTININNQSYLHSTNADYSTAHNAATGTVNKQSTANIGQQLVGGNFTMWRWACGFDTSALADDTLIESAYITGWATAGSIAENTVILKDGTPTYPTIPTPVEADYKFANYSGNGGTGIVPAVTNQSFDINFNYTGLGWINRTGYSKFLLVSEDDNNSVEPTGVEYSNFYTYNVVYPSYYLKLTVVHFPPTGTPAVGDPTFSSTKATYTKATANVTDAGGGYEERGFEYGVSETPTWAVRETGVWGVTGNYSLILPNLLPLTTYYVRAYVTNDYGTGYSDWTSFTTTDVPSYGIHTESNSANYRLYVSDDEAIAWQGYRGPYVNKQTNINITDLVNKTSGIKVLKLDPDAKGTFMVCVTVKQEIKS